MVALGVLLALFLFVVLFIFPFWAFARIKDLTEKLLLLENELRSTRRAQESRASAVAAFSPAHPAPQPANVAPPAAAPAVVSPAAPAPSHAVPATAATLATPSTVDAAQAAPIASLAPEPVRTVPASTPAPTPAPVPPALPPPLAPRPTVAPMAAERAPTTVTRPEPQRAPAAPAKPAIHWEQFMGVKLFAWLGGFAAFLGVAYGLKYSFENNLIPPEARAAAGFLFALGLVGGGLWLRRKDYRVTAETLVATGIVSLYAVTFACRAIYQFPFFGPLPTFALMALTTVAAFTLAIRLDARVVAVLGILGGFLTPILISTHKDNPLGLFTYLALLNAGLGAVTLNRRWHFLVPLGAACTVLLQLGWASEYLGNENTAAAMLSSLAMQAIFLGIFFAARHRDKAYPSLYYTVPVAVLSLVGFGFAVHLGLFTVAGLQPLSWLGFLFLTDACVLALAWFEKSAARWHLYAGVATFATVALWTNDRVDDGLLPWALGAYFAIAVLHSAFPLVLQRRHAEVPQGNWLQLFPPLALALILLPILESPVVSLLVWPAVLLIDLVAIVLAALTAAFAGVFAALLLTLITAAFWIFKIPADFTGAPPVLLVVGVFAVLFFGAGLWISKRLSGRAEAGKAGTGVNPLLQQLPIFSALLPFLLMLMLLTHLRQPNPTAAFGLVLLLNVLTLGLTRLLLVEWLPLCAVAGSAAVCTLWLNGNAALPHDGGVALGWMLGFNALFTVFPFVFRERFLGLRGPWFAAALSGVAFFTPVYRLLLLDGFWPADVKGVVALLFALPPLLQLVVVLRKEPVETPARLTRLALFGGTALFFLTLVFPLQFSRHYITLGWALEGVALLWLFHRVPHHGLQKLGIALLAASFARLALNPAILSYHAAGTAPIFNWFLAAYGITALCLFAGARLLAPPRSQVFGYTLPPLLQSGGVVLIFLLLNLEIADFFAEPGSLQLTFDFSGNFARDLSYTVCWALFAFILITIGLVRRIQLARYAALALFGVATLKLFFHDLAHLGALYRIGALFAIAVLAFLASVVYQRFLPSQESKDSREA